MEEFLSNFCRMVNCPFLCRHLQLYIALYWKPENYMPHADQITSLTLSLIILRSDTLRILYPHNLTIPHGLNGSYLSSVPLHTSSFDFVSSAILFPPITFFAAPCWWCTGCRCWDNPGDLGHPGRPGCTCRTLPRPHLDSVLSSVHWRLCKWGSLILQSNLIHERFSPAHLLNSAEIKLLCGLYCVGFLYMLQSSRSLQGSSFTLSCANIVSILVRMGP